MASFIVPTVRRLVFVLLLFAVVPAAGAEPLEVFTWAPTAGPEALWQEALGGLKAAAKLFNDNGGIGGRPLVVNSADLNENDPNFLANLGGLVSGRHLVGAVGGPVHLKAGETADLFRRMKLPWLGPWSNEAALYEYSDSDPFAVLPPWSLELPALLEHIRQVYAADAARSGPVFLVYYNFPVYQDMAAQSQETARRMGLDLKRAPLNPDFSDWEHLADYIQGSGAVIIWLSQGASAAFIRAAKNRMPEALYLTGSANATNRNLVVLSGGAWNGVIFPAVLKPSRDIPEAYEGIIRKYGPVGLDGSYQAYLGFAQGQILARALVLNQGPVGGTDLPRNLYDMKGFPTLLSAPVNYNPGRHISEGLFYLGRAYGNGHWEAATPGRAPEQ